MIVTIDGPAGSGKSTIAALLVERRGFAHIDTGAIYRIIGYIFHGGPTKDDIDKLKIDFKIVNSSVLLEYNGKNIEKYIRSEDIGKLASNVAKLDFVRNYVNAVSRKIADASLNGNFVVDGRDAGEVIFPSADLKFFFVADINERAKRRAEETHEDIKKIKLQILQRDEGDAKRNLAPLIQPEDAVVIDTTNKSIDEVYDIVNKMVDNV